MDKEMMKMLNDWKPQEVKHRPKMTTEEILAGFEELLTENDERDGRIDNRLT